MKELQVSCCKNFKLFSPHLWIYPKLLIFFILNNFVLRCMTISFITPYWYGGTQLKKYIYIYIYLEGFVSDWTGDNKVLLLNSVDFVVVCHPCGCSISAIPLYCLVLFLSRWVIVVTHKLLHTTVHTSKFCTKIMTSSHNFNANLMRMIV